MLGFFPRAIGTSLARRSGTTCASLRLTSGGDWHVRGVRAAGLTAGVAFFSVSVWKRGGSPVVAQPWDSAQSRTAIIVLGQSLNSNGSPPATMTSRATTAATQWKQDPSALVICCGGDPKQTGKSEAATMYDKLRNEYEPDRAQHELEEHSETTVANAVYCVPILKEHGITRVKLISSDFHLPRAAYFFEAVFATYGIDAIVEPIPAPTPPPSGDDLRDSINKQPLHMRIEFEMGVFIGREAWVKKGLALETQLSSMNPDKSKPIKPLPRTEERIDKALATLARLQPVYHEHAFFDVPMNR